MRVPALAAYTLKRLLVLGVAVVICYLLGLRDLWLLVVSLLGSGAISLLLLNKDRDLASSAVFDWSKRFNQRLNSAAAREDEILDALESAEGQYPDAESQSEDQLGKRGKTKGSDGVTYSIGQESQRGPD
jgi:hypothetical protein